MPGACVSTFTLAQLDTPPSESLKDQVLQMVVGCFSDISPVPLTPSNLLYPLYQYVIGFEGHRYLQAMTHAPNSPTQLILARDDEASSRYWG